jgi:hypothetical protein
MTGECMMSTSLWRMWEKKADKVCQKVLDLAYEFLDESGREYYQEDRLWRELRK